MNENLSGYWIGVLGEYEASGLNLSRFCRERELSYDKAVYWKRKFAVALPAKTTSHVGDFIELRSAMPLPACEKLVLHLNSGAVLEVPSGFDAATLRSTINILREVRSC